MRSLQQAAKCAQILLRHTAAVHLAGGFRQLVGFIHHQHMIIFQKRAELLLPVRRIRQQVIMIAYLYHDISSLGIPQVFLITAKITSRAIALAKGRYAYMAAVKTGKPQRLVQITGFLQGTERSFLPSAAMGFAQNLCKSFCQPLFTHEPFFSLAHDRADRRIQYACLHQYMGQKRQVFFQYRALQGHTGS